MISKSFIVASCILIGFGRFLIPGHDLSWAGSYEAFAHLFCGALLAIIITNPFGAAIRDQIGTGRTMNLITLANEYDGKRQFAAYGLAAITVLEIVMVATR